MTDTLLKVSRRLDMSLPVSSEYLCKALAEDLALSDMSLRRLLLTDLHLPSGRLVAADPFLLSNPQPFNMPLPCGVFQLDVSVAHFSDDQRVAFACIRFKDSPPVSWDMLTVPGQAGLKEGHFFGYPVDSGTGCFIDASAAELLDRRLTDDHGFSDQMIAAMEKTYVHTWSWLDMPFGTGNLVAFSSGLGDGLYGSYVGIDADREVSVVVTDFMVVEEP